MSVLYLLTGIALLIVLCYQGVKPFTAVLIVSIVVLLLNGMNVYAGLSQIFVGGFIKFLSAYFFILILGSLYGRLMSKSNFAKSFAFWMIKVFGEKNVLFVIIATSVVFSIVGINAFIIFYVVYPIGLVFCQEQNISKEVLVSAIWCFAFTMGLPGALSINNIICSGYLGTNILTAGWLIGVIGSLVTFALCILYTTRLNKKYKENGVEFVMGPMDHLYLSKLEEDEVLPGVGKSVIPLISVAALSIGISQFYDSVFGVIMGMSISCVIIIMLDWKHIKKSIFHTINEGLWEGFTPLITISALVGFGAIMQSTVGFQEIIEYALSLKINNYLKVFVSTNILVGITGSLSGGLTIFMEALAQPLMDLGVSPELFHRIAAMSCIGMDSLPHSAGIIGQLAIVQLSLKQAYKHAFFLTVISTLIGALVATSLAILLY
ncbi:H+/gluconate symporter [Dethiosulfatibacter aminovorans DSM 17477]|uniref:H+/gluconate symporter n=1 Tax=Dethiosulfatibacter aminovorans DSM 17477 TaxID=1121476 RepID=A0A1M6EYN8_9FIRM|nr:GntP family permease [Dethiosulfatibacter aminovorans]SHI90578.1 H+/gluconate symporter [Dethiosulfatibacter aminovorans DSM 17477]